MTWLEGNGADLEPAGIRLKKLIERPGILGVPGAHNGLAGMLAKEAGFEALYISGGAVTATMGLPDLAREAAIIQRMANARRRSGRTSVGTWYVAPPTRLGFTSRCGVAFRIAASNTSTGSTPVRSSTISKARYSIRCARDFFPSFISILVKRDTLRL